MDSWHSMMRGKAFITDVGEERTETIGSIETKVGRYALWSPVHGGEGHTIVEVGSCLETLMKAHNIPMERVCMVARS